jgi:hypothetical protein
MVKQPETTENTIDKTIDLTVPRMLKAIDYLVIAAISTMMVYLNKIIMRIGWIR